MQRPILLEPPLIPHVTLNASLANRYAPQLAHILPELADANQRAAGTARVVVLAPASVMQVIDLPGALDELVITEDQVSRLLKNRYEQR